MDDSGALLTPSDAIAKQCSPLCGNQVSSPEFDRKTQPANDLAAKNAALQQLNEEKIRWILAAAHDLLNKVNTLQALAEMLAEDRSLHASNKTTLESMQVCTDSMTHLLQDFEEIARAEAKKPWLELMLEPLLPVIEQSVALSRQEAGKKNIRLTLTCRRSIARLRIDTLKLTHGIFNVLKYVIRYGRAGGNIDVLVDQDENSVFVSVQHRGLSLPEEELSQMFTPFHRSRTHPASADDETFLGLAISRCVIQQHGGDIWAESKPGEGTRVCMTLPLPGHAFHARTKESKRKRNWPQPHPHDG
jgi:signal transduction histidine kinase